MSTKNDQPKGAYEAAVANLLHGDRPQIVTEQAQAIVRLLLNLEQGAVGSERKEAFRDAADIIANEFLAEKPEYIAPTDLAEKLLSPVELWVDMAADDPDEAVNMDCRYDGPYPSCAEVAAKHDEDFAAAAVMKPCRRAIMSEYVEQLAVDEDFGDLLCDAIAEAVDDLLARESPGDAGPFWANWGKSLIRLKPSFAAHFMRLLDRHAELEVRRVLTEEEAERHRSLRRRLEVDESSENPVMPKSAILEGATAAGEKIPLRAIRALQWMWRDELSSLNDGSMSDAARLSAFHATLLAWVMGFAGTGGKVDDQWCAYMTVAGRIVALPPKRERRLFFAREDSGRLSEPFDDYEAAAKAGDGRVYAGRRVRLSEALEGQGGGIAALRMVREGSARQMLVREAVEGCLALGAESPSSNPDIGLGRLALSASTRYPKIGVVESVVAHLDGVVELGAFVVDTKPCDPECAPCADFPSEFKGLGDDNT